MSCYMRVLACLTARRFGASSRQKKNYVNFLEYRHGKISPQEDVYV